jgi:type VI secretion system secreted protein VgrG
MTLDTTSAPQSHRLDVTVASGDLFDVRSFRISQRMSALFEISLVALCQNDDVDFEAIAGQPMRLTLRSGDLPSQERTWTGVCNQIEQLRAEERGLSAHEIRLAPTMWLLTQRRNHRMFQRENEVEIVTKILGEWGITPVERLSSTYKKRKYRVQYAETDFAFVCRMMEEAGISFFFEDPGDSDGETKLVMHDTPQAATLREPPIAFRDTPTTASREHITNVRARRMVRPGKYTLRDHDYRRPPGYKLLASAKGAGGVEEKLERFHYTPGAFLFEAERGEATPSADDKGRYRTDESEAAAMAQRRLEAKRAIAKVVTFDTNTIDPAPGAVLSFLDHPRSDLGPAERFLVLSSEITGDHAGKWVTACEVVNAANQYRPAQHTPKPRVNGVESATVVGPAGEEIHTDEFGRVRVHFHWDRESRMDDNSSCWIHVSQPWSGAGFGGTNLPRIGQEVIVDFLGGDPERPVIVGRLYTNLQKTPYRLPDNKTQSGWQSRSSPAGTGDNYNELMFEDAKGSELLRMQAEKDLRKLVKNDEDQAVGRDRSRSVGRNETVNIGKDLVKQVAANERELTGLSRNVVVGVNRATQVGEIDSTIVGNTHTVIVMPPGEGLPDGKTVAEMGGTSITIQDDKIELVTRSGSRLTFDSKKIELYAPDGIVIKSPAGDILIDGRPKVRINPSK